MDDTLLFIHRIVLQFGHSKITLDLKIFSILHFLIYDATKLGRQPKLFAQGKFFSALILGIIELLTEY